MNKMNANTDHKAATDYAEGYRDCFGNHEPPIAVAVLATAYLELRELAKADVERYEPKFDTPTRKALRAAIGEE